MTAHITPYAGSWYPRQRRKLAALLEELFDRSCGRAGPTLLPGVMGLLAPHAAPVYSGGVAAAAYRCLRKAAPERVFVLGFSHRRPHDGVAVPAVDRFCTPLGEVVVDSACARQLAACPPFHLAAEYELCDHSVEIQLPFLQYACPSAAVVPLYVGHVEEGAVRRAAEAIARVWRPGDVLIASSDLTHYGRDFHFVPFPADDQVANRLRALDHSVIDAASAIDPAALISAVSDSGATVCGYRPISLLLGVLRVLGGQNIFQQELDYQTSGELTGDFGMSVSYAALGYYPRSSFELGEEQRRELLAAARESLDRLRATGERAASVSRLPGLDRKGGAFVTLRRAGRLLGCIGTIASNRPLGESVPRLALAAALDDPRRPAGPLPEDLDIEISILTPLKLARRAEAIRIGEDGVYLDAGAMGAILLPQAARPDWTAEQFVAALFRKAGLRPSECSEDMRLFTFRAQVFHDGPQSSAG